MKNSLNRQAFGLVTGLSAQFILGMAINLFVEFPGTGGPHATWSFTLHNPLVFAHLLLGTLIVLDAITMVVRAVRQRAASWLWLGASGLLWVLVAWGAGDTFVTLQADILSYIMSLGFLLAMLSYAAGLYRSRNTASLR